MLGATGGGWQSVAIGVLIREGALPKPDLAVIADTGGMESGVRVGLVNYPRFPCSRDELWRKAEKLAEVLRSGAFQHSVLLCGDDQTKWASVRDLGD